MNRLFLIDGSALAFRSFYAFGASQLKTKHSDVGDTGAIFGFASTLFRLIERERPTHLAVIFDTKTPTFRHTLYPDYKAHRTEMPESLAKQLPHIRELVEAMNIPFIVAPGYEADDIIGTYIAAAKTQDFESYMVTGDKDFMQLLAPHVYLYNTKNGEVEIQGVEAPMKKFGIPPEHVIDMLALMGDSSDNVPGVPGVGEKTAQKLIHTYGSLDGLYARISEVTPASLQTKLVAHKDLAYLSLKLVTIHQDVPLPLALQDLEVKGPQATLLSELFQKYEFDSLRRRIPSLLEGVSQTDRPVDTASFLNPNSTAKRNYHLIRTPDQLGELCQRLNASSLFALDTETTSLNPLDAKLVMISVAMQPHEAYGILLGPDGLTLDQIRHHLGPILANPKILKGGQNIKYDLEVLAQHELEVSGLCFDTMLASYLLDPESRAHSLDDLAEHLLHQPKITTASLLGKGKDAKTMADVPIDQLVTYACEDADYTLQLHHLFESKMKTHDFSKLYRDVEVPLAAVLADMELTGIALDTALLTDLSTRLHLRLGELEQGIHELAQEPFNVNSPKQLAHILYEKLAIHTSLGVKRLKKTKTGYSTDQDTLESMAEHPMVELLLEYRNLNKLISTYIDVLPTLIHPKTGRVHTSFNQSVTATGRLSSSNPNLQNIPIRHDVGKEIRKAFVAGHPGWKLLSADYSQIELRLLAHYCQDPDLIETFVRDEDIHRQTAAKIFRLDPKDVTPDLRSRAKAINFGVLYGMGPHRLARETGLSFSEAQHFIEVYFSTFPRIRHYLDSQVAFAREHGYVETLLKRRRPLPDIHSKNKGLVGNAERMATNTPLQGSAADLIKLAMVRIHERLKRETLQAKMLLQVHDELVFEAPESECPRLKALVIEEMQGALKLHVPLKVDCHIGHTWADVH